MASARRIVHELGVAARIAARALARRLSEGGRANPDPESFRAALDAWLADLPPGLLARHRYIDLPARQPPWLDTGIDVATGETVTWLADGRVYLSRALDVWIGPTVQLWARVGEHGPIFRGTRATHTFVATQAGRLYLAGYFPGEWSDRRGGLATPPADYAQVDGGLSVLVLQWNRTVDAAARLRQLAKETRVPGLVLAEARRLDEPAPVPEHWDHLWSVGPSEIYRTAHGPDGRATICCRTHLDTGILQHEARVPLEPRTLLRWSWKVDALPTDLPEDTLPSHDHMSIAVEFDDGQDLTYHWSSCLPVGTVYRCPLPNWAGRETHVVQRSGPAELGRWLDEERDVYADYRRILGGPAREIVRVWLIALSLLQRGTGACEYARIGLESPGRSLRIL